MKVKSRLFSISNNLDSVVAAIICFVVIQIFSKHSGIGVSPDSVTYLSAARHLGEGNGFLSFDNLPVVDFPIAYPFFLAVISFCTRLDPLQFGAVLNGILFGILCYLCGSIMNGFEKKSIWYKRILLCCLVLSPALQEVYSLLWSETVFLLLIILFIHSISKYLRTINLGWLTITALICAIACLTRYAGVFLIITGLGLIFFQRDVVLRKRITHSLIYGFMASVLFLTNIYRNLAETGLAMGPREKSVETVWKNMEYFGGVLSDWLLLERKPGLSVFLTICTLLIFLFAIGYQYFKKHSTYRFERLVAVTGLVYCVFMIGTSSITRYEQFTNRLLSPMFIPLLWSVSFWIPGFIAKKTGWMKLVFMTPILLLTSWFLNLQLRADYENYDGIKDAGIPGYREDPFQQSALVQYIKKYKSTLASDFIVYSNAGDAVYFVTGLPAHQLPRKYFPDKVKDYYREKNNYLVWFNDAENAELPDLITILANKNMTLVKEFPEGAVYVTK